MFLSYLLRRLSQYSTTTTTTWDLAVNVLRERTSSVCYSAPRRLDGTTTPDHASSGPVQRNCEVVIGRRSSSPKPGRNHHRSRPRRLLPIFARCPHRRSFSFCSPFDSCHPPPPRPSPVSQQPACSSQRAPFCTPFCIIELVCHVINGCL